MPRDFTAMQEDYVIKLAESGNKTEIRKIFKSLDKSEIFQLANYGIPEAQYYFAIHHCNDISENLYWLKKAADNGNSDAQFNLGNKYNLGIDVNRDVNLAMHFYEKAAENGNIAAKSKLIQLGNTIYKQPYKSMNTPKSKLMPRDFAEMQEDYVIKLAESGNKDAQYYVAMNYSKNILDKVIWLNKSSIRKNQIAKTEIRKIFKSLNKSEIFQLANYDIPEAQYYFAIHHCNDISENLYWLKKAADNGNSDAQFNLGNKYNSGIDVNRDVNLAMHFYEKAAENGNIAAKSKLVQLRNTIYKQPYKSMNASKPKLIKYIPNVIFDNDYDGTPRFNSEYNLKKALFNRIERACYNISRYFDSCNSSKLSNQLTQYYSKELTNLGITHNTKDIKEHLEIMLLKYYKPYTPTQLIDKVQIGYLYGKYYYNASKLFEILERELILNTNKYANDVYNFIIRKYTIN